MNAAQMDELVEAHLEAEMASDVDGATAMYTDDIEHDATGTVQGEFLGVSGNGKRITFRLLHVWEFRDGRISRENVWMDGGSVVAQLTGGEQR